MRGPGHCLRPTALAPALAASELRLRGQRGLLALADWSSWGQTFAAWRPRAPRLAVLAAIQGPGQKLFVIDIRCRWASHFVHYPGSGSSEVATIITTAHRDWRVLLLQIQLEPEKQPEECHPACSHADGAAG